MPLGRLLLLRTLYAILFLAVLISLSYAMVRAIFGIEIGFVAFVFEPGSLAQYTYIVATDVFMVFLRRVNLLLGEKNLVKLLLGRYYRPYEEQRIFMFLDLQASTPLAERLGHLTYSRLLQDCFNDLGVVARYGAEVYQYVGDEAVLTWEAGQGLKDGDCLKAFYAFRDRLESRDQYYRDRYGCGPFFKAGAHLGKVTVTEVGKYKREIAFHGDTLNTAARIQAHCNKLKKELLITETLYSALDTDAYSFEILGKVALRGKVKEVGIVSVARREDKNSLSSRD